MAARFDLGTPWIFWSGVAACAVGLLLVLWALLADRLRRWRRKELQRRRCPRCWYDLHDTALARCPECGHEELRPRRLLRSRRRWRWAVAGFLLAGVGAAGLFNARIHRFTWVPLAPSWLLVRMVDDLAPQYKQWGVEPGTPREISIRQEVRDRYISGQLSEAQRRTLLTRQLAGKDPVGLIARRRATGEVLVELDARFAGPLPREFRAEPQFPGGIPIAAYHAGYQRTEYGWHSEAAAYSGGVQSIGSPPGDAPWIDLRASVSEAGTVIWTGTIRLQNSQITPERD